MRRAFLSGALAFGFVVQTLSAQQPASQAAPTFKSSVNLVLVDVVVRDRSGAVVSDLKADDFELLEAGKRQAILTFAFEEIKPDAAPIAEGTTLTLVANKPAQPAASGAPSSAPASADIPSHPLTSD